MFRQSKRTELAKVCPKRLPMDLLLAKLIPKIYFNISNLFSGWADLASGDPIIRFFL